MKGLHMVAFILLIVGGLNWLLEAFGWGIGNYIPSALATLIYVLVGLSAIYEAATHAGRCKECKGKEMPAAGGSM